jgi:hypothetical protein
MSLRDDLARAVACCAPIGMQHATNPSCSATGRATNAQQTLANPHEIRGSRATGDATTTQQTPKNHATNAPQKQAVLLRACCAPAAPVARTCRDCAHRLPYATCGRPVEAGLAPRYGIRWAPAGWADTCPAYTERIPQKDREKDRNSQTNSMR